MDYKKPRVCERIEDAGAKRLRIHMKARGWDIIKTHGSIYQEGLPDLYCFHSTHGVRWIETKAPGRKLRQSQIRVCNRFGKKGIGVWVLEDEKDYCKLFQKDNWMVYV